MDKNGKIIINYNKKGFNQKGEIINTNNNIEEISKNINENNNEDKIEKKPSIENYENNLDLKSLENPFENIDINDFNSENYNIFSSGFAQDNDNKKFTDKNDYIQKNKIKKELITNNLNKDTKKEQNKLDLFKFLQLSLIINCINRL